MLDQLEEIMQNHVGQGNSITTGELAEQLEVSDKETNPKIRDLLRKLMVIKRVPVGSCNHGYFVVENRDEYQEYLNNLHSRIRGIEDRIRLVTEVMEEKMSDD